MSHPFVLTAPIWIALLVLAWWQRGDAYVLGEPFATDEPEVIVGEAPPGGIVTIRWQYDVIRDCPREVQLFIANGHSVLVSTHNGSTSGRPPGPRTVMSRIRIPLSMTPGPATITSVSHWRCTPLREHVYSIRVPIQILDPARGR